MIASIWKSFPQESMFNLTKSGNTYMISVHVFKRKVTYTFEGKSASYMVPFTYDWKNPVIKK